jgi:transposase
MKELLETWPNITGVRMLEELRKVGYRGGKSILNERLRQLRPKPKRVPVIRFETDPGHQGQMDWSPYTLHFSKTGKQTVQCFSYILGFSRRQYIAFTDNRKFFTLIRRHVDAFNYFGGVVLQCLYDNEKTVVLRWEAGRPVFNPAFIDFITHYQSRPYACKPGKKETKGNGKLNIMES